MQNRSENQVNVGFFVRLAAFLVDWLIVKGCLLIVRIPMWISSWGNPDNIMKRDLIFQYSLSDILFYVLTTLYFVVMTYSSGATVGKRMFHLQVQSIEDRKMTFFEVLFRETVGKYLSGLILCAGYLMIGARVDKKGLHDLLSDTEVVYRHDKKEFVTTPINVTQIPISAPYIPQQIPRDSVMAEEANQNVYVFSPIQQQNSNLETTWEKEAEVQEVQEEILEQQEK